MLSVARDPFFKFANVRIKREKRRRRRRRREKKRERTRRGEVSIDLRANPLPAPRKSEREKGDEKEEQESEARPNPMKMFRVIANSSTRQSTPWSADDGGSGGSGRGASEMAEGVWDGVKRKNWRHCAWVVHYDSVDSPIRCVAFATGSSCQSVWKVRPFANCDLSPRKSSLISVDSARKRGKSVVWCRV